MGMFKNTKETKEERDKNRSNLKGVAFCLAGLLVMFLISQVFAALNRRNEEKRQAVREELQRFENETNSERAYSDWFRQYAPEDIKLMEFSVEEMNVRDDAATIVSSVLIETVGRKADIDRAISLSKEDERTRQLELLAQEKKLSRLKIEAKEPGKNPDEIKLTSEYIDMLKLIQDTPVSRENVTLLRKRSEALTKKIERLSRPGMEVTALTTYSDSTVAVVTFVADADWNIIVTSFKPYIPSQEPDGNADEQTLGKEPAPKKEE